MAAIGQNTTVFNSFSMSTNKPLDDRILVATMAELTTMPEYNKYPGMQVYVTENNTRFKWNSTDSRFEVEHVGFCSGQVIPDDSLYMSGDIYINTTTGDVYYKEYNYDDNTISWVYKLNIIGPKGDSGGEGLRGPRGSYWYTGNNITGGSTTPSVYPLSGIADAAYGDMYVNSSGEVYNCTLAGDPNNAMWVYTTVKITGPQGERGTRWFTGIGITGEDASQSLTFPNSGVDEAIIDDQFLNSQTGNVYKCTKGGAPDVATWIYHSNIMGPSGPQGEMGPQGEKGDTGTRGTYIFKGNAMLGPTDEDGTFQYPPVTEDLNFEVEGGDLYLNPSYGHVYMAESSGLATEIKWNRLCSLMGGRIYAGTTIDGDEGSSGIVYAGSGIDYGNNYDIYINQNNARIYMCTKEGKPADAQWTYILSISGINKVFTGATETSAGTIGAVPAPAAGPDNRYLSSTGAWNEISSGSPNGVNYIRLEKSMIPFLDDGYTLDVDNITLPTYEEVYNEFKASNQKSILLSFDSYVSYMWTELLGESYQYTEDENAESSGLITDCTTITIGDETLYTISAIIILSCAESWGVGGNVPKPRIILITFMGHGTDPVGLSYKQGVGTIPYPLVTNTSFPTVDDTNEIIDDRTSDIRRNVSKLETRVQTLEEFVTKYTTMLGIIGYEIIPEEGTTTTP